MRSLVIYIFLYACESWTLTAELKKRTCLFVLSFYPRDVLDEILNLIESVSEGFHRVASTPELVTKKYQVNEDYDDVNGRKSLNLALLRCIRNRNKFPCILNLFFS